MKQGDKKVVARRRFMAATKSFDDLVENPDFTVDEAQAALNKMQRFYCIHRSYHEMQREFLFRMQDSLSGRREIFWQ